MTEHVDKAQLLGAIHTSYTNFEAVLAPLSSEQMTTPGVNGTWSIKDNIAHISAWQRLLLDRLQAVRDNVDYHWPWNEDAGDDEINEQFYQQNKARSIDDVLTEFRSLHQQVIEQVQAMSNEDLNRPLSWRDGNPIWPVIVGNTSEHYPDHMQVIQDWLAKHNN